MILRRIAVLASGEGETLESLLLRDAHRMLGEGRITLVASDREHAPALERARRAGKPTVFVDPAEFPERDDFDCALHEELARHRIQALVLAGFMRILGPRLIKAYPLRIINVHPSLLPAFPGLDAPARALAHGVKVSGCTVHLVDAGVDTGPIIAQVSVPVLDDDTPESLHRRIKDEERWLLPKIVRLMASGTLSCEGRMVRLPGWTT
jgi:phosphoribosylglycinamide formyltransferase-1